MKTTLLIAIVWLFLGVGCGNDSDGCVSADSDDETPPVDDDNDDTSGDDDNNDDTLPPDDDDDDDNDNNDNNDDDTSPDDDDDTISDEWEHELVDAEANWSVEMVIDAQNRVHLTYLFRTTVTEMKYARKENGNWLKETIAVDSVDSVFPVALDVDSSGAAHAAYYLQGTGELYYATNETGELESLILESGYTARSPEIDVDTQNNIYIVYAAAVGRFTPVFLWSKIAGEWQKSLLIEDAAIYCFAVDDEGHFFAKYATYDTTNTLAYVENTTGDWVVHDIETVAPGERLAGEEMVLSPSGPLFFAFGVDEIRAKRYGSYYTDSYQPGWQEVRIPGMTTNPRLAVDGDEKAHVVSWGWYATNRSGEWTAEYMGLYGGSHSAIATDSENRPFIAYTNYDAHELYLAVRKE